MLPHNGSHGSGDKSNNYSSSAGGGNSQVCKKNSGLSFLTVVATAARVLIWSNYVQPDWEGRVGGGAVSRRTCDKHQHRRDCQRYQICA